MTSTYNRVEVTTSAILLIASNANRKKLVLRLEGPNTVFIGKDTSITASAGSTNSGYPLDLNEDTNLHDTTASIYGICETGTGAVSIVEEELS